MMGRTIIQPIGPLYGEAVNGTVYGRPNGSIYVPPTNTIKAILPDDYIAVMAYNGRYFLIVSNDQGIRTGVLERVAESQDIVTYMAWEVSDDSDFTTSDIFSSPAGQFNLTNTSIGIVTSGYIVDGTTYYLRAVLFSNSGVPVAYSETFELTGVVPE